MMLRMQTTTKHCPAPHALTTSLCPRAQPCSNLAPAAGSIPVHFDLNLTYTMAYSDIIDWRWVTQTLIILTKLAKISVLCKPWVKVVWYGSLVICAGDLSNITLHSIMFITVQVLPGWP